MLRIEIIKKENIIKQINFYGHTDYDDYGKDIVCASVSSIVTTTVNGILALKKGKEVIKGEVTASNIKEARDAIRKMGLVPTKINEFKELKNVIYI